MAAILRIFSGYFFLVNVFVILIQADGVIEIFYDVLALQFVQQLDDIAFNLGEFMSFFRGVFFLGMIYSSHLIICKLCSRQLYFMCDSSQN